MLNQKIEFSLFLETGTDIEPGPEEKKWLELVSLSNKEFNRIIKSTRIAHKRNRLREKGESPFVYLADDDIILPEKAILSSLIRNLNNHPQLGAIGLGFHHHAHLGCASMMLRRKDWLKIGSLRGTGHSCVCGFILRRLKKRGFKNVAIKSAKGQQLSSMEKESFKTFPEVLCPEFNGGPVDSDFLRNTVDRYGGNFRLSFSKEL